VGVVLLPTELGFPRDGFTLLGSRISFSKFSASTFCVGRRARSTWLSAAPEEDASGDHNAQIADIPYRVANGSNRPERPFERPVAFLRYRFAQYRAALPEHLC
jgi:hypothetical protein